MKLGVDYVVHLAYQDGTPTRHSALPKWRLKMTLIAMKAKGLVDLFEADEHGFKYMADFAETIEWATEEVLIAAMSLSYD